MPIFLDTSKIKDIERFHAMGIIRGVTTNPTIMVKDGVTGGMKGMERCIKDIARVIDPLPVSVEVLAVERKTVIQQALTMAGWADTISVKIPIHGPHGELENLEIVHELVTKHNVRINVTAMMSAQQCFLAALAGATYVSIFGGRVNNMGYNVCGEIQKIRKLLDQFSLPAQIVIGSSREVLNVIEWLEAGAHIVTVLPSILEGMLVHPYTKETVQMFLEDGAKLQSSLKTKKV